ncbi:efflux RND transporter permease subunit [Pollutimonas bauzanensis]|uniref:Multidrug efflux pump subunit AcrB n=1 Tax=Pollutimonas bauzanensis TaxID=658167 RepID=A0A1M5Y785_9BURK|nr:efflux RND transporter permease subunit [Pollutimonas bauzanensis]SHI07832.1 Multidrug efflux pump subunit AcrB [Pollutimonas bauzanensis]
MSGLNLSAFGVRERAITLFLILAIAVAGAFAFIKLGRAEDPSFTVKIMTISAIWPGATAGEMQQQVGDRLEKRLQELDYYDRVETAARPGLITMKLYLKDSTPPDAVPEQFYQVRKKLGDEVISLPRGVIGPVINDEYSDVYFSLFSLEAKNLSHRRLVAQAEVLRQRLLRVGGVQKVNILGEQQQKIYVEISHQRLATLGIKAQALFDALNQQNNLAAAGFVETAGPRVYLRLDGAIDSVETVKAIPLVAGGRILKIGDIADVRRGYEDPQTFAIRTQGEPALMLAVVMKKGFNGLKLGKSLEQEAAAIEKTLPLGITFFKVSDQARAISAAVDEFMIKFFMALAVVIVVSLATLGFRVGIVVAAAVPLTLAAVFLIMLATGRDFDRITLGALILSLGLLVDDAIIAIEMMVVKMEEGMDRVAAATFAWGATAAPMASGTLVTIIGFLPVGFARSTAGEYAGNIFWVVAFSLVASWVVAVLFIPYLGVKLLPAIKPKAGGHAGIYETRNYRRLRSLVRYCVDHKWLTAGITVGLFGLSVAGVGSVQKQFFPNSERPELTIEVNLPPGSAFGATDAAIRKIEAALQAEPQAGIISSYIGQGAPRFFLSVNPELPNPAFGQIIVLTEDSAARDLLKARIRNMIAAGKFAEARVRVSQFLFGPPVPFPVLFRVVGPDLDNLRAVAKQVRAIVEQNPDMRGVHLDWGDRAPTLRLVLDQERLRLLGLTPRESAMQLQALLNGSPSTQVREGLRSVEVVVRSPLKERRGLKDIGDMTLTTQDGRAVPLSQVAKFETRMEDAVLKRYNRETYIAVQGDIRDGAQPPDVTRAILPALAALKAQLPEGYRIDTGGSVEESAKADAALGALFPLMIILMLTVIMIQVRSFATMWMVFATAPLGLVGAVPALLLFHQPFGFNAILGLIGLAGILMRNTLILVDQIRHDLHAGLSPYDAVIESTVRRARPVILTAAAAMLAFIPLTHSAFWGPLAYVLIGGVGVGTALTLLFLPALYSLWFRVRRGDPARSGQASGTQPATEYPQ